jgi:hypothetical protein
MPRSMFETAIYTRQDGVVDWRYCITGHAGSDFEVSGTHIGLAFNAAVFGIIAKRLHDAQTSDRVRHQHEFHGRR